MKESTLGVIAGFQLALHLNYKIQLYQLESPDRLNNSLNIQTQVFLETVYYVVGEVITMAIAGIDKNKGWDIGKHETGRRYAAAESLNIGLKLGMYLY